MHAQVGVELWRCVVEFCVLNLLIEVGDEAFGFGVLGFMSTGEK